MVSFSTSRQIPRQPHCYSVQLAYLYYVSGIPAVPPSRDASSGLSSSRLVAQVEHESESGCLLGLELALLGVQFRS